MSRDSHQSNGKKCPDEKLVLLKIYSSVTGISFITKKQGRKTPMWKQQKKRSFPSSYPLSFCFCGSWTYLSQTWSVHIQSGPSLHSERSPHGQQGWRCQNLIQKKTVSNLLLHCTANKISGINNVILSAVIQVLINTKDFQWTNNTVF